MNVWDGLRQAYNERNDPMFEAIMKEMYVRMDQAINDLRRISDREIRGGCGFLFHAWDCDCIAGGEKGVAG